MKACGDLALGREILLPLPGALHAPSRPARELPRRVRRPPHDGADVLEREREEIVQHEGDALGRAQRVEHDHHGGAHGVGEQDLALRIARPGVPRPRPRPPARAPRSPASCAPGACRGTRA